MHRSPGVFFDHDRGKTHASGKYLFAARVIPYRGSWLDFEFDAKDLLYVRIDRKRKLPVTTLLMALPQGETDPNASEPSPAQTLGMSRQEILSTFYTSSTYTRHADDTWAVSFKPDAWKGIRLTEDLVCADTGKTLLEKGKKITARILKQLEDVKHIRVAHETILGKYIARDFVNQETGEIYAEAGDEITDTMIQTCGFKEIDLLDIDHVNVGGYLRDTLAADKNATRAEALVDIYRVTRPGDPPTVEGGSELFHSLFFNKERYDLSSVGRVKMNARLGLNLDVTNTVLTKEDIISIIRVLLDLKDGKGETDDIDSLANRRIRSVGELLENQYRAGLMRMERSLKERLSTVDLDTAMPHDLINAKPITSALREFFGTSQLSQFMDQTNPLSEINHKRRLSALGPGGLTRERAGFEVRDVHPTHYGRICPIETPEGQNIGLINSLATYARISSYGFIETPYRRVKDGHLMDEVVFLSAMEEGRHTIAQATSSLDAKKKLQGELISCRRGGDYLLAPPEEIDFIDVSPKQIVSVAASLIPFIENDDASRALMGANMQRQAVPLIRPQAPLVGTGMECPVALGSGVVITAHRAGIVDLVDASRIVVHALDSDGSESPVDIYKLQKFQKSNASTCVNQKPLVKVGDQIQAGDVIADGSATELGELALGRNVLVAFVSWNGYCFEDSIVISERLVKNDAYTSIHIEEFDVSIRDTKMGSEEITRDIPGTGEEALRQLDETGIVYIGAEVKAGDILVGKVTPKSENPMTPEEKLLRAIFGEKASDVRDTSLKLPPGVAGTIVGVRVFSRRGVERDERTLMIERAEIARLMKDRDAERSILERTFRVLIKEITMGQTLSTTLGPVKTKTVLTEEIFEQIPSHLWKDITVTDKEVSAKIKEHRAQLTSSLDELQVRFDKKVDKVRQGDDLPAGVLKTVKVFVAVKRKLQPGDKMAGRHGNKGVVSQIVPVEDMPYLADGTPVDIILNPLGLPSRMNVGQILETHLGWAARGIGQKIKSYLEGMNLESENDTAPLRSFLKEFYSKDEQKRLEKMSDWDVAQLATRLTKGLPMATPVFDGAHEADIVKELKQADLDPSGQVQLYDGRTGDPFDSPVTVGIIYMLKLHHLVDEKIHARSVGPYSLVTQQPLGGKAQFGGQRLGEMEVWALEAYGAAYTLQEMLTVKSDDVSGRIKVYESIIRGDDNFETGIPESFNVLTKELSSLALNMECVQSAVDNEDESQPDGDSHEDGEQPSKDLPLFHNESGNI
eukprot:g8532.t1